jgi:integrase
VFTREEGFEMAKTLTKEDLAELNRPRDLTVLAVKNLKPTAGLIRTKKGDLVAVRLEIPDTGAKGLRLIVQPSGAKSWAMRFRRPDDGKSAKLTLGPVDLSDRKPALDEKTGKPIVIIPKVGMTLNLVDARRLAAEINSQRAIGNDVIVDTKADKKRRRDDKMERASNTFGSVVREFVVKYRTKKWNSRPRRWFENAATLGLRYPPGSDPTTVEPEVIKGSLAETWATKPITEIDKYQVEEVIEDARKHGSDGRARALFSVLSVLFGWLPLKYRVGVNPMIGVRRPGPPKSRDRKLDNAEVILFWKACDAIDEPTEDRTERGIFGALYKVLLLTGCRLREPAGLDRTELGDNGVWEVPGERTKNHLPFLIPMSPLALKIINSVQRQTHRPRGIGHNNPPEPIEPALPDLIFTTNGRTPVSGFSKAKKALDTAMAKIAGKPIKPWRVHDLRRTFSTTLNESPDDGGLGIAPHIVEAALNHISGGARSGVAGTYNKAKYLSEKRVALQRWATHIEGLVSGRKAKVVSIRKRGAS